MAFLDENGLTRLWNKIKDNFVDLSSSQTITGSKTFSGNYGNLKIDCGIVRSISTSELILIGGTQGNDEHQGAKLGLRGGDRGNGAGTFFLQARGYNNGNIINKFLTGSPDGTLTWTGEEDGNVIISNQIVLDGTHNNNATTGLVIKGNPTNYACSLQDTGYTKGTLPSTTHYWTYGDAYGTARSSTSDRVGMVESSVNTAGLSSIYISAYGVGASNTGTRCTIVANVDATGNAYTAAPTPETSDNSTKIATTAYVKAQGYITSSGSITGSSGSCTGNAATASKLGTATVGGTAKPIYLNAGAATAISATVGSASKPVYLNGGTITVCSATVGSATKPVYMNAGALTAISATVGSASKPIFLSAGTLTALSATVGAAAKPIWLNAGTLTAFSATVGGTAKPVYLNAGTLTAITATVGTTARPVYLNGGTITQGLANFGACSASAAGTAGPVVAPAKGKQAQFLRGDATWAAPSTSSDRRVKQDFSTIPDDVLDIWGNINYKRFKLKEEVNEKGQDALYHTGLIVQDIQEAFESKNLDANKYDMIIHEIWPAHDDEYDEDGNLISPKDDGYEQYYMHYEEALSIEAAYLRRKIKMLEDRITELENKSKN